MKILMITPYLPYPLYSGGQIRSYNLIKNLSKKHEIILFSFMKEITPDHILELKKFCKDVFVFPRRRAFSPQNIILAALSPYPFLVAIYLSLSLRQKIREELQKGNYDLIHAETFYVMPNIPKTKVPILLVEQTIEYLVYAHFVETVKFAPFKLPLLFDISKIKFWESFYWKKADKVVAMSKSDKQEMRSLVPSLSCEIVPNGIDARVFSEVKKSKIANQTVLFVGNFSWLQNREAVFYLTERIWPKIKKEMKHARLWIVGRNPTEKIKRLSSEDIKVDENVSDIRQAYSSSQVLLAPIFGPGGTRFKILEAMASGLPVVTTPTGIEGIPVRNDHDVLIGNDALDLASATIRILKDDKLGEMLSTNSKKLVETEFDWSVISEKLDKVYKNVAREKH